MSLDASVEEKKKKHLVFLVDGTASMGNYLDALRDDVLPQSIEMARLLGGADLHIHIIVYRDYDTNPVVQQCVNATPSTLQAFLKRQKPEGGADFPEATKTGFNTLFSAFDAVKDQCLVIHYTDAPPHHARTDSRAIEVERKSLKANQPGFDWYDICRELQRRQMPVYSILSRNCATSHDCASFYVLAAAAAGGTVVCLPETRAAIVTRATIGVLMHAMGDQTMPDMDRYKIVRYVVDENAAEEEQSYSKIDWTKKRGDDENNNSGYLPHATLAVPHEQVSFSGNIASVDWLGQQLHSLPTRLKSDTTLRDTCFEVFARLFTPQRILCLTYNALFGKVWRMMCHFRDDERLPPLRDALSQCVGQLAQSERDALRAWIDASYDQTEEITALVYAVQTATPYFVLDGSFKPTIDRKDLLSLATSPNKGVLQEVQRLLCGVICVAEKNDDNGYVVDLPIDRQGVPHYIPCALQPYRIFAMLAHLVYPGVMFTLRPAAIIASLALLSGNATLKKHASEFLASAKGKWLNLPENDGSAESIKRFEEVPELLSVEYIKLMHRIASIKLEDNADSGCVLTEKETTFYSHLYRLWRIRCSALKLFTVRVGFTPQLRAATIDVKLPCSRCKQRRSWTLMCENGVCGLCNAIATMPRNHPDRVRADGLCEPLSSDDSNANDDSNVNEKSHMVECRTCSALYAVIDVDSLRVTPKCHYCRNNQKAITTQCERCLNHYISPSGAKKDYTCAMCLHRPGASVEEKQVTLLDLLAADRSWAASAPLSLAPETVEILLYTNESFFKMYVKRRDALFAAPIPTAAADNKTNLLIKGKSIVEADAVLATLAEVIERGSLSDECALCFEPLAVNALQPICGGQCPNRVCGACATGWWSQAVPGQIVMPSQLVCAFCKQVPTAQALRKHNRAACAIVGRKSLQLDSAHWFAWCKECYEIKAALPRECAAVQPEMRDYVCQQCVDARNERNNNIAPPPTAACPSCGHATVKDGGCNHITCVCGAHWCYKCGFLQDENSESVYEHMMNEHGNYGY
jgi:hypothetical protein